MDYVEVYTLGLLLILLFNLQRYAGSLPSRFHLSGVYDEGLYLFVFLDLRLSFFNIHFNMSYRGR